MCVIVGVVGKKCGGLTCGIAVGVHSLFVAKSICVINWFSWPICVCSDVISSSLAYIWMLICEFESVRLDIDVLSDFVAAEKCDAALFMPNASSSTVVTVDVLTE